MTDITTATVETTTQPAAPATLDAVRLKYGMTARYILRADQPAERPKPDPPPRSPTERRTAAAARSRARLPEDDPS